MLDSVEWCSYLNDLYLSEDWVVLMSVVIWELRFCR